MPGSPADGGDSVKTKVTALLVGTAVSALVLWQTAYWSRQIALEQIGERSRHTLTLIVEALRGDLDKFRTLPQVLAADDVFRAALLAPHRRTGFKARIISSPPNARRSRNNSLLL